MNAIPIAIGTLLNRVFGNMANGKCFCCSMNSAEGGADSWKWHRRVALAMYLYWWCSRRLRLWTRLCYSTGCYERSQRRASLHPLYLSQHRYQEAGLSSHHRLQPLFSWLWKSTSILFLCNGNILLKGVNPYPKMSSFSCLIKQQLPSGRIMSITWTRSFSRTFWHVNART